MNMADQTKTTGILRFIRCGSADESYGLDMSWVRSIQRTDRFRRNPAAREESSAPVGWLPGNEGDIPVFSLARRLGRSSDGDSALQRIVVLYPAEEEKQTWALLVDRVSQVISIPAERAVPLPPVVVNPAADYFQGVIRLGDELILFLSPERLHPEWQSTRLSGSNFHAQSGQQSAYERLDYGPAGATLDLPSLQPLRSIPSEASGPTSQVGGRGQLMLFSTARLPSGERPVSFGLSISQVPEILVPLPLVPVPEAPAFVLGLVNWRDRPVPVLDLDARLGLAPKADRPGDGQARLIITRDKGCAPVRSEEGDRGRVLGGFIIQPAVRTMRLPIAHQPCQRSLDLDQRLTRGVVELENETLVIPDVRSILA
jgi:chemotaxis signal transduction protein